MTDLPEDPARARARANAARVAGRAGMRRRWAGHEPVRPRLDAMTPEARRLVGIVIAALREATDDVPR